MKPTLTTFANWCTYDVNMIRTWGYVKYRDARVVYFRQYVGLYWLMIHINNVYQKFRIMRIENFTIKNFIYKERLQIPNLTFNIFDNA